MLLWLLLLVPPLLLLSMLLLLLLVLLLPVMRVGWRVHVFLLCVCGCLRILPHWQV
jgi:hypothetical protein